MSDSTDGWDGIFFYYGDTSTMDYCVVENAGQAGFGASANIMSHATVGLTIANCTIKNCSGYGVHVGDSPTITNCLVDSNTSSGIYTGYGTPMVKRSNIADNRDHGIYCVSGSEATVDSCTITNNWKYGIYLSNSSPVIRGTQIVYNDSFGVYCEGNSQPVIGDTQEFFCEIYRNGTYEVYVNGPNDVEARWNCWGTGDSATIEAVIFDSLDNPSLGRVHFAPWIKDQDVMARQILAPIGFVPESSIVTPQAEVRNVGLIPAAFPVILWLGSDYCDTTYVTTPLDYKDVDTVTFRDWIATLGKSVTYTTLCSTALEGDMYSQNDTVHGSVGVFVDTIPDPVVMSISPRKGGDVGGVIAEIIGHRFREGATVRLTKNGMPDVVADSGWTRVIDSTRIIVGFDLREKSLGSWNVVVTNPDSGTAIFRDGFTVEPGHQTLWVNVIGRDLIRVGRPAEYLISFGNSGNVDAYGVTLTVSGIPSTADVDVDIELMYPPAQPGEDSLNWSEVPFIFEDSVNGGLVMPLYVPVIPPQTSASINIVITPPFSGDFDLRASLTPPGFEAPVNPGYMFNASDESPTVADCWWEIGKFAAGLALDLLPTRCVHDVVVNIAGWAELALDSREAGEVNFSSAVHLIVPGVLAGAKCAQTVIPFGAAISAVWTVYSNARSGVQVFEVCSDALRDEDQSTQNVRVRTSIDPNDKANPAGFGDSCFVGPDEVLHYVVFFENVDSAAFAAESIWIVDTLDENLDWDGLELGEICAGAGPDSIHPDLVVMADFDSLSGIISWGLFDINLPPDTAPYWGEGWVSYTISPVANLTSGTRIENIAAIKFDQNEWILAPMDSIPVVNTVDALAPGSSVLPLPDTTQYWHFEVHWSGADDSLGSGVRNYTIYVSDSGSLYHPWLAGTSDTMAIFEGEEHTYSFYSIATDNVGHHEAPPDTPDAVISVVNSAPEVFALVSPADSTGVLPADTIYLDWEDSYDPDSMLYCLYLSPDHAFTGTLTTVIDSLLESEYTLIAGNLLRFYGKSAQNANLLVAENISKRINEEMRSETGAEDLPLKTQENRHSRAHQPNGNSSIDIKHDQRSGRTSERQANTTKESAIESSADPIDTMQVTAQQKELIQDTTYYWKVKAYDKYGAYRWSTETWRILVRGCGDSNGDGRITVADATYLVTYIYRDGPDPVGSGDVNLDGRITIADATYIITYIYRGGSAPCDVPVGYLACSDEEAGVTVADAVMQKGEVTIPVTAGFEVPVAGIHLEVTYDSTTLEPLMPEVTTRTEDLEIFCDPNLQEGQLKMGMLSLKGSRVPPGDGPIMLLRFRPLRENVDPSSVKIRKAILVDGHSRELKTSIGVYNILPKVFSLSQNYPNPFRNETLIRYALPANGKDKTRVSLKVYDAAGRLVKTVVNDEKEPGYHIAEWNCDDRSGRRVGAGVYFYRLRAGEFTSAKKMIVLR